MRSLGLSAFKVRQRLHYTTSPSDWNLKLRNWLLAPMESELGRTCLRCPNKGEELGTGELKRDLVTGLKSLFQGNPVSKCQTPLIC